MYIFVCFESISSLKSLKISFVYLALLNNVDTLIILQNGRTVPIFKAGSPLLCDNYRPISMLSTLSKLLEKIVCLQLVAHLEDNNILYEHQYGFQHGKSTEHNLIQLTNFLNSALNEKKYAIGIFLVLKKAFDVCSHEILLRKL
jgi:hypothetical protein